MQLVLRYGVSDGFTYFCRETLPVEYDSAEALLCDLMDAARTAVLNGSSSFEFLGHSFSECFHEFIDTRRGASRVEDAKSQPWTKVVEIGGKHYIVHEPDVFTIDEWFGAEGVGQRVAL
jgi:hypothetical protein